MQFVEYNAIDIEPVDFELPSEAIDYFIFTSQNGVQSFLKHLHHKESFLKPTFCVGEKTKSLLEENKFNVAKMAQNAMELGKIITKSYKNASFLHFTGNLSREELPKLLSKKNIRYKRVITYHTLLKRKKFNQQFDGVLFFSPSGVDSFFEENTLDGTAFCIGQTTANTAKKYTDNFIIANRPTIENVIVQAIKYFDSSLDNLDCGKDKTEIIYD